MGRRIRWLGVFMVVCFRSRRCAAGEYPAGQGQATDRLTAQSADRCDGGHQPEGRDTRRRRNGSRQVGSHSGRNRTAWTTRTIMSASIPSKNLFSGITGYDSIYYGRTNIEAEYNSYLESHQQTAQTLSQILFREKLPSITDNVTLTVEPKLQEAAEYALSTFPPTANKDGAIVVLNPKTGAVLAMYSSPSYDPNVLVSTSLAAQHLAYLSYTSKDHEGLLPSAAPRHRILVLPGLDHEGRDVDRGVQPQTLPGGIQLSVCALSEVHRLEQTPLQRRLDSGQLHAVWRHHDGHAARIVRPWLCRTRDPTGRRDPAPAGRAVRHQRAAPNRLAEQQRATGRWRHRLDTAEARRTTPRPSRAIRRSDRTPFKTPRCRTQWWPQASPTMAS